MYQLRTSLIRRLLLSMKTLLLNICCWGQDLNNGQGSLTDIFWEKI